MKIITIAGCMLGAGILSSTLTVVALRLADDTSRRSDPIAVTPAKAPTTAPSPKALVAPAAAPLPDTVEPAAVAPTVIAAPGANATTAATPAPAAAPIVIADAQPAAAALPPQPIAQEAPIVAPPPAPSYQPAPPPTIVYQAGPTIIYEPPPVVIAEPEEVTYVIYREYFGCSEEEAYLIPHYRRYYGVGDEDLFVVCFVARHAHIAFEVAFRDFYERCGGRHGEFVALYRVDPLLFFTPINAGERCPPVYQRSYDWYFHHRDRSHAFTADEFRALVSLKIAAEYQAQSPSTFFSLTTRYGTPSAALVQERDRCGAGQSWSGQRIDQPVEHPWHLRPAERHDWETRFTASTVDHEKSFRHDHPEVMERPTPPVHIAPSPVTVAPHRDGGDAVQHPKPVLPGPAAPTVRPHLEPDPTAVHVERPVSPPSEEPAPAVIDDRHVHTERDRSEDARHQPVENRPANADPVQMIHNGDGRPSAQARQSGNANPAVMMQHNGESPAPERQRSEDVRVHQPEHIVDARPQQAPAPAPAAPRQSANADPGQMMRNNAATQPGGNGRGGQNGQ